jgi:hypothetical protein
VVFLKASRCRKDPREEISSAYCCPDEKAGPTDSWVLCRSSQKQRLETNSGVEIVVDGYPIYVCILPEERTSRGTAWSEVR